MSKLLLKYSWYRFDNSKFKKIFGIESNYNCLNELQEILKAEYVDKEYSPYVSPGVMSNSPDRFDGFHSDGACCRHESDKGRSKENLSRYTQDRRAYEFWEALENAI